MTSPLSMGFSTIDWARCAYSSTCPSLTKFESSESQKWFITIIAHEREMSSGKVPIAINLSKTVMVECSEGKRRERDGEEKEQ